MDEALRVFGDLPGLSFASQQADALRDADALLIVTEWRKLSGPWRKRTPSRTRSSAARSSYNRLTAAEALKQLQGLGFDPEVLPSPSTMADVLNRNGYRLRPVLKAKPQKNSRNRCHLHQSS
jgi:hypothetical protein